MAWHWHDTYLVCDLLAAWPHAFGSRHSDPATPAELAPAYLGIEQAYWGKQVHRDRDWRITANANPADHPEVDAVITDRPNTSAWVCSADCVPVLIAHPTGVAAIHAGWRGTAAQIVPQVIQQFPEPTQCRVALGPAIAITHYQVGKDVAAQVLGNLDSATALAPDPDPGKVRLDVREVIRAQCHSLGIPASQISIAPHCTYSDSEHFFSYRRQQQRPMSVQWSGIGQRPLAQEN